MPKRSDGSDEKYYFGSPFSRRDWKSEAIRETYLDTSRLSQRAFGWQYPKQYWDIFKKFVASYQRGEPVKGFAYCLNDKTFLLVPTIDKLDMGLMCFVHEDQKLPDDRSYIEVKGRRSAVLEKGGSSFGYPSLIVEDFSPIKITDSIIKPDASFEDFGGMVFDNWSEIPEHISDSISLSIVSSPADLFRPIGGLTTDLFLDREQRRDLTLAKRLVNDLKTRIDSELLEDWEVKLPAGRFKLNPLRWKQFSLDGDREYEWHIPLLARQNANGARELTLNLGRSMVAPPTVDDLAASKSDIPLILPSSAERRRRGSLDPAISNFILTTHQNFVVAPRDMLDAWLPRISEKIEKIRLEYADVTAFSRLVNPDLHSGTAWGVVHTAYARSRSQGEETLTEGVLDKSLRLSVQSWRSALEKWSEVKLAPTSVQGLLRASAQEQRQIYFYVRDHPDVSKEEIKYILFPEMNNSLFESLFGDALRRGLIYEYQPDKYRAT